MAKCDFNRCDGHLGKFESCVDEALWELSLEGFADGETGDVNANGHYVLMLFPMSVMHFLGGPNSPILIPAGNYIIETTSNGAVHIIEHDSEEAAYEHLKVLDEQYLEWLGAE